MALSLFGNSDPLFGQMERAMDRAFNRALTGRDIGALMPALTSSAGASTTGHPMVSRNTLWWLEMVFSTEDILKE